MINYKDHEIDIAKTNFSDGVAILPLPTGEIVCIPEEGATAEELELIEQIKADVAGRPPVEIPTVEALPSVEEQLSELKQLVADLASLQLEV